MPLAHAILGFLEYQPMTGYDLKNISTSRSPTSGPPRRATSTRRWKIWKKTASSKSK